MKVLSNISRFNGQPKNVQEGKHYAKALATIKDVEDFGAAIASENQKSDDLDTSEFGIALDRASVPYSHSGAWITGTMSMERNQNNELEMNLLQIEATVRGYERSLSFTKDENQSVYVRESYGETTRVVHDHKSGTLSMFLEKPE